MVLPIFAYTYALAGNRSTKTPNSNLLTKLHFCEEMCPTKLLLPCSPKLMSHSLFCNWIFSSALPAMDVQALSAKGTHRQRGCPKIRIWIKNICYWRIHSEPYLSQVCLAANVVLRKGMTIQKNTQS